MSDIVSMASYVEESKSLYLNEKYMEEIKKVRNGQQTCRDTLVLVRAMLALIAGVQRHRGATMALLGGDERFTKRLEPLQKEVSMRTDMLMLESDDVIDAADKDNVIGAWKTISLNWQDDAVLENFEYHSHSIEYLLRLVRVKGDQIADGINEFAHIVNDAPYFKNLLSLSSLSCVSIPDAIELIGKLRALAVHAAAVHQCDSMTKSRIDYLLKELGRLTAKLDHQIVELDGPLQKCLVPGVEIAQAKVKRDYLVQLLSNDIVEGARLSLDSEMVYRVTTEVIDTYYSFCEAIITHLENQLPKLVNRALVAIE